MQVQVIVLVDVDDGRIERPSNMTDERYRECVAKSMNDVFSVVLKKHFEGDDSVSVDFIAAAPVLEKTDPFFAT